MQNLKNTATEHTGAGHVGYQAAGVIKVDERTETELKPQSSRLKNQNNHLKDNTKKENPLHYTKSFDPLLQTYTKS